MFTLVELLTPERTRLCANFPSQKRVLEFAADIMANSQAYNPTTIFDALIAREHLGTTAIGQGVALPHTRLKKIKAPLGCFIRLEQGIDFHADDKVPVDLIFTLLLPPTESEAALQFLKTLAVQFRNPQFTEGLRHASSRDILYRNLVQESSHSL